MSNTQLFLDPVDTTITGLWTPPGPIPIALREFGRFPDTRLLRPGDLVLVSSLRPNWIERTIIGVQLKAGFAPSDARWHQAAIYLGYDRICELKMSRPAVVPLYRYVVSYSLRVRRDPSLSL